MSGFRIEHRRSSATPISLGADSLGFRVGSSLRYVLPGILARKASGRSENRGFADSAALWDQPLCGISRSVGSAALRTLLPVLAGHPPPEAAQHPPDELEQLPEHLQNPSDPTPYPLHAVPEPVVALLVVLCHVLAFRISETLSARDYHRTFLAIVLTRLAFFSWNKVNLSIIRIHASS